MQYFELSRVPKILPHSMLLLLTLFLAPFLICMLGLGLPVRPCKAPVLTMGTAIYMSLHTLEPRNPQKVPPGVSKKCRKSPRTLIFDTFLTCFRVFWDFFDTFLTLRAGRPGKPVLRLFFGISGLAGVETPVYGGSHRNPVRLARLDYHRGQNYYKNTFQTELFWHN